MVCALSHAAQFRNPATTVDWTVSCKLQCQYNTDTILIQYPYNTHTIPIPYTNDTRMIKAMPRTKVRFNCEKGLCRDSVASKGMSVLTSANTEWYSRNVRGSLRV